MAYEREIGVAATGTEGMNQAGSELAASGCPTWDRLGTSGGLPPFFNPREDQKRQGFVVKFHSGTPRKETTNKFNNNQELWFDIEHQGQPMTWTINQISLLMELKKHEPLAGKAFGIRLLPVDDVFKQMRPKYKGKDRYEVKLVPAASAGQAAYGPHGSAYRVLPGGAVVEEEVVEELAGVAPFAGRQLIAGGP